MERLADRLLDELVAAGSVRVHPRLRHAVHAAGGRRPGGRPRVRSRAVRQAPGQAARGPGAQAARVPLRAVHGLHRGPPPGPRDDIMTAMATATFPDGSMPEVNDVALLAANLFSGGQETTVRLLSFALRILAERPDIQDRLRSDRDRIPNFIEETLRFESPLRAQFRMAKVTTEVAGVPIPAGSTMMLLPGAANRDPRLFENPDEFDVDRDERQVPRGLRARHPPLRRRSPGPGRGSGHASTGSSTAPRASRSPKPPTARRRPPLRVPADLLPPRPRAPRARAHPGLAVLRRGASSSFSWDAGGPAVVPPSTGSTTPVIWAARSLARKTAASATSSAGPCAAAAG